MKAIYAFENSGTGLHGHDLGDLFSELSEPSQLSIRRHYVLAVEKDPVTRAITARFPKITFDLDTNLAENGDAFDRLRYEHEVEESKGFLLGHLPVALHRAILEAHPDWDEVGPRSTPG